jgi:spermidine/putrescine transport system permease protein
MNSARAGRLAFAGFAFLVYVFLLLPLGVIVLFSFNSAETAIWPVAGFSLQWYRAMVHDQALIQSVLDSLTTASIATFFAVIMGTMGALALSRYSFRGKGAVSLALLVPIIMPGLVTGIALLSYFKLLHVPSESLVLAGPSYSALFPTQGRYLLKILPTVIMGHMVFMIPFVIVILMARLQDFDLSVEEAAQDLGASPLRTFLTITLPIIRPALIGAAFIVFALSFDEFIITFFVIGSDSTLPLKIWSMMRTGIAPSINAVASIVILLSLSLVLAGFRFTRPTD